MREAILLYTTVAMGPMLPEGEKTRGEKILRTLRSGCVAERSCGHCKKEWSADYFAEGPVKFSNVEED